MAGGGSEPSEDPTRIENAEAADVEDYEELKRTIEINDEGDDAGDILEEKASGVAESVNSFKEEKKVRVCLIA